MTFVLVGLFSFVVLSGPLTMAVSAISQIEPQSSASTGPMPDWQQARAVAASLMEKPATGQDPLTYFIDPLGRQLGFPDAVATLAAKKLPPSLAADLQVAELTQTARRLVRSLAAWNVAKGAQHLASATDAAEVERLARHISEQAAWLAEEAEMPTVRFVMAAIPALKPHEAEAVPLDDMAYRNYAASMDAKYPLMSGSPDSWLEGFEKHGIQAWHDRLTAAEETGSTDMPSKEALAERYLTSRLLPVLRLRLAQQGSQLETWAAERAYRDWLNIYGWKDSVRLRRGFARLCGSWQWTVHNHQNHGEQKLTVSFPASVSGQNHAGPAEIVVLGDLVYLRWEAGGRVQEDSLLFSKEGQRLEGTFVNNMGGWGSVTGKRTAGCPKK
jgi:hypothetical protein